MKKPFLYRPGGSLPEICFILVLMTTMILSSCTTEPEPYSIMKFYGNTTVRNYSRSIYLISFTSDSINPGALIVRNGDILDINEFPLVYTSKTGDSLNIKTDKNKCFVNGKLASVKIMKSDTAFNLLRDISKSDLTGLSMLSFDCQIPDSVFSLLKEISLIRPDLSLAFGDETNIPDTVLKMFNPKFLMISEATNKKIRAVSGLTSPEALLIDIYDTTFNSPLPAIPSMKQLIISIQDFPLPAGFFSENLQLERLSVIANGMFDFAGTVYLKSLKEISIFETDTILNREQVKNFKNLESISIMSVNFKFDSSFDDLKNLRWISFSSGVSQSDFQRFIGKHPNLEVVEILDNKDLLLTETLLPLKRLYGLILSDSPLDSTSLNRLKDLKYLSIPEKSNKDKESLIALQSSMPNTIIAANEGLCLGSGWLLLLFPAIIAFGLFFRYQSGGR